MNFYYEEERASDYIRDNEPLEYPAHFHQNIELVYMNSGTARVIADGVEYPLKEGDFFIAFPETIHSYDNCSNTKAALIIVSPLRFPEYSSVFADSRPQSPVVSNAPEVAKALISHLVASKDKFDSHTIRGMLLSIFGILLSQMDFVPINKSCYVTLQEILRYCGQNCKTDISVEKMSKDLRISKSYISHTFSNKLQIPFRTYINTLRLHETVNLLGNTSKNITEIAIESGFETIRTFNRVFKAHFGVSPAQYRKENF